MIIKRMPLSALNPAPFNPRTMTPSALKGLTYSIDRFGMVEPIVWNEQTGHIVGGHQRFYVLRDKNETETHVVVVHLTEIDEKALNIALNNPNIAGEFDDSLQDLLAELQSIDDFDDLLLRELQVSVNEMQIMTELDDLEAEEGDEPAEESRETIVCPRCGCKWYTE